MHSQHPHPYYYFEALETLRTRKNLSEAERRELMTRVALNAADLRAAAMYADLDKADWQHFYPAEQAAGQVTTNQAIDTFLEQYGHRSDAEDALLERLIFNPTPDYQIDADGLDATAPADEQDSLIDSFVAAHGDTGSFSPRMRDGAEAIGAEASASAEQQGATQARSDSITEAKASAPAGSAPAGSATTTPDQSLSESLARIFVKQGKYERAFEIISSLNLNNPKKSVYFADQLRFLQKLIEIERARASRAGAKTNQ